MEKFVNSIKIAIVYFRVNGNVVYESFKSFIKYHIWLA